MPAPDFRDGEIGTGLFPISQPCSLKPGGLVYLGKHDSCKVEKRGASPVSSIKRADCFRLSFPE